MRKAFLFTLFLLCGLFGLGESIVCFCYGVGCKYNLKDMNESMPGIYCEGNHCILEVPETDSKTYPSCGAEIIEKDECVDVDDPPYRSVDPRVPGYYGRRKRICRCKTDNCNSFTLDKEWDLLHPTTTTTESPEVVWRRKQKLKETEEERRREEERRARAEKRAQEAKKLPVGLHLTITVIVIGVMGCALLFAFREKLTVRRYYHNRRYVNETAVLVQSPVQPQTVLLVQPPHNTNFPRPSDLPRAEPRVDDSPPAYEDVLNSIAKDSRDAKFNLKGCWRVWTAGENNDHHDHHNNNDHDNFDNPNNHLYDNNSNDHLYNDDTNDDVHDDHTKDDYRRGRRTDESHLQVHFYYCCCYNRENRRLLPGRRCSNNPDIDDDSFKQHYDFDYDHRSREPKELDCLDFFDHIRDFNFIGTVHDHRPLHNYCNFTIHHFRLVFDFHVDCIAAYSHHGDVNIHFLGVFDFHLNDRNINSDGDWQYIHHHPFGEYFFLHDDLYHFHFDSHEPEDKHNDSNKNHLHFSVA
ncbi:hypothetical protein QR680_016614 [Steinernema hermaphroditum]|uniref:Uncharacterized protein n=1 Tax=Steinernema hermaphroditum TaxID=289476 RepID=A0AA39HBS9_9BILA|nr:hypothetical protein QR680_016614 [Steinernema hermaphroditum]